MERMERTERAKLIENAIVKWRETEWKMGVKWTKQGSEK